jgi:uncharacterized protein DUF4255/carboxypeptidase family protein
MIHLLTSTLKSILEDPTLPKLVNDAEVTFERPGDSYTPNKTTINLLPYDVRENAELRSNEPLVDRLNGIATLRRPPLRVTCSYQVTAWIGSGVTGEQATLDQHHLLGEVLKVFSRMPSIEDKFLQGDLKSSLYPVYVVTAQADLIRNPAEFWSAMGGKLRPSFTVTATIAMDQDAAVITAPEVATKRFVLKDLTSTVAEGMIATGGTVRDSVSRAAIESVDLSLVELQVQARSDRDGRFQFSGVPTGGHTIRAAKSGYSIQAKAIQVPGLSPNSFDIELSPSPP